VIARSRYCQKVRVNSGWLRSYSNTLGSGATPSNAFSSVALEMPRAAASSFRSASQLSKGGGAGTSSRAACAEGPVPRTATSPAATVIARRFDHRTGSRAVACMPPIFVTSKALLAGLRPRPGIGPGAD
jgi:hypothetical protein